MSGPGRRLADGISGRTPLIKSFARDHGLLLLLPTQGNSHVSSSHSTTLQAEGGWGR